MAWDEAWRRLLPIDDELSDELVEQLRVTDFRPDLLFEIPVDGPWSPGELVKVARGELARAAEFAHQLPIDEPLTTGAVVEFSRIGYGTALSRIFAGQGEGPVSLSTALDLARAAHAENAPS